MLHHGHIAAYILEAVIYSIPKNSKGDINSSDNYRGIALSSALGIVLDLAKHSTVMCTAALKKLFLIIPNGLAMRICVH